MLSQTDIPFYEDIKTGVFTLDNDCIADTNPSFRQLIGDSERELTGQPFIDLIHQESHSDYNDFIENISRSSISVKLDIPNKTVRWIRISRKSVADSSIFLVENVTQEMIMELIFSRLAEGFVKEQQMSIFSSVVLTLTHVLGVKYCFVGIFHKEEKRVRVKALSKNSELQPKFSYPLEGTPCADVLTHDYLAFSDGIQEAYPEDQDLKDWNVEGYMGVPLRNKQNQSIGHLAIMDTQPIENTDFLLSILKVYASRLGVELERVLGEKELLASEEKYRHLFENAFEAKMIYDENHDHYLEANHAARELFGYPKDFFVGLSPLKLKPETYQTKEYRHQMKTLVKRAYSGEMLIEETVNKKSDGTFFHSEIAISLLDRDKRHFLVSVRDVSKRKDVEEQLRKHQSQLEELVKARTREIKKLNKELLEANRHLEDSNTDLKSQKEKLQLTLEQLKLTQSHLIQTEKMASLGVLTSGMAHELNNSMNTILGGINQMTMEFRELDDLPIEILERIDDAVSWAKEGINRTTTIVKGLSSYGLHNSKEKKPENVDEVVESAITLIESRVHEEEISLKMKLDADLPVAMHGNQISKVLLNVLDNAIYFASKEKCPTPPCHINVLTSYSNKEVVIQIFNTGETIAEPDLQRIYDPFFTTKTVGEGPGLGLSVAYSFLQQHLGTISHSNTNGGVLCTIKLPR